ncbi:uncharacterized protein BJ171DRAFT_585221 [Polychytrium aggregatum]|uniref:uncharacterized protein n=1 Tax=Polychytrium aggregatum TaxID=110093 RepID=UPI0022FE4575|nr:uncharacterized protein BJ171DRAFT_585221 [Polychytrium aggregatum]KAI9199421.1 hypothetical protein BJ171DRAFT_585221 [Polychytrium aggregatum]
MLSKKTLEAVSAVTEDLKRHDYAAFITVGFVAVLARYSDSIENYDLHFRIDSRLASAPVGSKCTVNVTQSFSHIHRMILGALFTSHPLDENESCKITVAWSETGDFQSRFVSLTFSSGDFGSGSSDFVEEMIGLDCQMAGFAGLSPAEMALVNIEGSVTAFLESLAQHPNFRKMPLDSFNVIHPEDYQRLLVLSNANNLSPQPPRKSDQYLANIFVRTVQKHPRMLALIHETKSITYEKLFHLSKLIAQHLIEKCGVQANDRVALMFPKSIEGFAIMLGVILAGAAYVPIDNEKTPPERAAYIIMDSASKVSVIVDDALCDKVSAELDKLGVSGSTILLTVPVLYSAARDLFISSGSQSISITIDDLPVDRKPSDGAYIIYTSGTTGKPKGVLISQGAIANLVVVERDLFQLSPGDRVFQNFSHSFDFSIEEIWMAYSTGASLVIPTKDMIYAGPDLPKHIQKYSVTVFCCVPSQLGILVGEMPSVKMIVLGGEAAQENIVQRYRMRGRKIFNTYGPTETTCSSTYLDISEPVEKMTIGRPFINYTSYVVDSKNRLVPIGAMGELVIGGKSVAEGYINRDDLTAEKFIHNPFDPSGRMYKTGDLVRYTPEGNIEYFGRIDCQVKIRGFRVELGEIESNLSDCDGIQSAIAHVWTAPNPDTGSTEQTLVAYLVLETWCHEIDDRKIREKLRATLPPYMIPSVFQRMLPEDVPRLTSGKIDRKKLPPITAPVSADRGIGSGSGAGSGSGSSPTAASGSEKPRPKKSVDGPEPMNGSMEDVITAVWKDLLGSDRIANTDNFFHDLGGHSFLAAKTIGALRKHPRLAGLSVRDLYENPTIAQLATLAAPAQAENRTEERKSRRFSSIKRTAKVHRPSLPAKAFCGLIQASLMYLSTFFSGLPLYLGMFYLYNFQTTMELWTWHFVLITAILFLLVTSVGRIFAIMFVVVLKWLLLGQMRERSVPVYSFFYLRWWIVKTLSGSLGLTDLQGSFLLPFILRLLGCKIGRDCNIFSTSVDGFDLIEIGHGSTIGNNATIIAHEFANGYVHFKKIKIGENCVVGVSSVVEAGGIMNDGSELMDSSLLSCNDVLEANHYWGGCPGRDRGKKQPSAKARSLSDGNFIYVFTYSILMILAWFMAQVFKGLTFYPGFALYLYASSVFGTKNLIWAFAPAAALINILFSLFLAIVLKWILLGKVKAERIPVVSFTYIKYYLFDAFYHDMLTSFKTVFNTQYVVPWLRMMGCRLGKFSEVAFFSPFPGELLTTGQGSFIADAAVIAPPYVSNGWYSTGPVHIGDKSFVGNAAVAPAYTHIASDSLLGVASLPPRCPRNPEAGGYCINQGETWLGNEAVRIPFRNKDGNDRFGDSSTYQPSFAMRLHRYIWEAFRILVPSAISAAFMLFQLEYFAQGFLDSYMDRVQKMVAFPALAFLLGVFELLLLIVLKWIFIGRYKKTEQPMYSTFVRRTEFLTGMQEQNVAPFLGALMGTPFLSIVFRMLGARVGKNVFWATVDLTEHDLLTIGDNCTVGSYAVFQTHLFEDRVMKLGPIEIGKNCNIRTRTIVLYDVAIGNEVDVNPLSLVVKGESLPDKTTWEGLPVRHTDRRLLC